MILRDFQDLEKTSDQNLNEKLKTLLFSEDDVENIIQGASLMEDLELDHILSPYFSFDGDILQTELSTNLLLSLLFGQEGDFSNYIHKQKGFLQFLWNHVDERALTTQTREFLKNLLCREEKMKIGNKEVIVRQYCETNLFSSNTISLSYKSLSWKDVCSYCNDETKKYNEKHGTKLSVVYKGNNDRITMDKYATGYRMLTSHEWLFLRKQIWHNPKNFKRNAHLQNGTSHPLVGFDSRQYEWVGRPRRDEYSASIVGAKVNSSKTQKKSQSPISMSSVSRTAFFRMCRTII